MTSSSRTPVPSKLQDRHHVSMRRLLLQRLNDLLLRLAESQSSAFVNLDLLTQLGERELKDDQSLSMN